MAKIQIKSEKLTPFGGFFSIMEQFDALLAQTIDSTLGLRCTMFGYQYSEILRSLMCVYLCGGSCIEDVTTHLMKHLSLHPTLRTCSADTILRAIEELTFKSITYKSASGKSYDFNTADKMNCLLVNALLATGQLKSGQEYDFDFDHQFIETEKYDAKPTYKKFLGYSPGVAVINDMIVGIENRDGNTNVRFNQKETLERIFKRLEVILGARSAVFLPFKALGLVIIDEEHETSFKQQDPAPRYHARSAAIVLAKMYGAKTLLGTATPSMESYYNAQQGKYGLVELKTRYKGIQLPEIQVVDVKDLRRRKMMSGPFSPQLLTAVREALKNGQQAILFQNRRGFAPMVECKVCGWVPKCKNCDVSLTLHKSINLLTCHYCGYTYPVPTECPNCGSTEIMGRGFGTEKIEDQIAEIFPEAKIARMDLDTTRTRNAYERLIADFSEGRTNLLIGTQMVSKGLDFDKVSVVGILNADSMLNYPDFRAYEHAFMMMAQVSGRAGRKGKRGLVILQTKNPTLPVIGQVVHNDYAGLYQGILEERRTFHYPPFFHLINVYVKHKYDKVCEQASHELSKTLRSWFGERVLGPDKPAVARVKTMNIRKIVIKLENGIDQQKVREYLKFAQQQMGKDPRYGALQIYYDVDPL